MDSGFKSADSDNCFDCWVEYNLPQEFKENPSENLENLEESYLDVRINENNEDRKTEHTSEELGTRSDDRKSLSPQDKNLYEKDVIDESSNKEDSVSERFSEDQTENKSSEFTSNILPLGISHSVDFTQNSESGSNFLYSQNSYEPINSPGTQNLIRSSYSLTSNFKSKFSNNSISQAWNSIYRKKASCQICLTSFQPEFYSHNLSCTHLCLGCLNIFSNLGGTDCPICKKSLKILKLNLNCSMCKQQNNLEGVFLCKGCFYCKFCCLTAYQSKKCKSCQLEFDQSSFNRIMAIEKIKIILKNS